MVLNGFMATFFATAYKTKSRADVNVCIYVPYVIQSYNLLPPIHRITKNFEYTTYIGLYMQ